MEEKTSQVLMIEDDATNALLMQDVLHQATGVPFHVSWADTVEKGLERLSSNNVDIILLDLHLPDSSGYETFTRVHAFAPQVPVVVMTGLDDERVAIKAVQEGAQDFLIKGDVDKNAIVRSVRYALERSRLREELLEMSYEDELTHLYNRRGFTVHAQRQLELDGLKKKAFTLCFIDVDGLKQINDTFGHKIGDQALMETASILRKAFRECDIIARLGGDEFAVFMSESEAENEDRIRARVQDHVNRINGKSGRTYQLSLSIGMIHWQGEDKRAIEEVLDEADAVMYEHKRKKKGETSPGQST